MPGACGPAEAHWIDHRPFTGLAGGTSPGSSRAPNALTIEAIREKALRFGSDANVDPLTVGAE